MIMRKVVIAWFLICLLTICASPQSKPFEDFRKAVKEEPGGFAGNKENLSKVFNDERVRLGERFEPELWLYIEDDPDKHFWIASFIDSKSYLHGNSPLPELAFRIREKSLGLLGNDKGSRGRRVSILRELAIASKLTGNQEQAIRFRDEAEELANDPDLSPYISGRTRYDACIYANITGSISSCNENEAPNERIISAGWMNRRAINFQNPRYPSAIKKPRPAARVDVRIVTDVDGKVISADVFRGPIDFHNAALDAARKLKFPPIFLSGVPTKISGWVSFDFKP
jgi:hypothetical protein